MAAPFGLPDEFLPPFTPEDALALMPAGPAPFSLGGAIPSKAVDLLSRAIGFYGRPSNLAAQLGKDVVSAATLPGDVAQGTTQLPSVHGVPGSLARRRSVRLYGTG